MREMNGNEDLTLIRWLMTLRSNAEIIEYISTYMGSKPGVHSFQSDFLRHACLHRCSQACPLCSECA